MNNTLSQLSQLQWIVWRSGAGFWDYSIFKGLNPWKAIDLPPFPCLFCFHPCTHHNCLWRHVIRLAVASYGLLIIHFVQMQIGKAHDDFPIYLEHMDKVPWEGLGLSTTQSEWWALLGTTLMCDWSSESRKTHKWDISDRKIRHEIRAMDVHQRNWT